MFTFKKIFFFYFIFFYAGCLTSHKDITKEQANLVYKSKVVFESEINKIEDEQKKEQIKEQIKEQKIEEEASELEFEIDRIDELEKNSITKLTFEQTINELKRKIDKIEEKIFPSSSSPSRKRNIRRKATPPINGLQKADIFFKNRNWKKAILAYEDFRKANPQSSEFKIATLKIGKSFIRLGLKKEARSFFKEVMRRFPQSRESKEASSLIKTTL